MAAKKVQAELDVLVAYSLNQRADALGEILAQADSYMGMATYFMDMLSISATSYPATVRLLHIGGLLGLPIGMYAKSHAQRQDSSAPSLPTVYAQRPRPPQLLPALTPPIPMPGHPSYPSGHATQAMLMANLVDQVFADPDLQPNPRFRSMSLLLRAMAERIARNREIAGLHYPSDSVAGQRVADALSGTIAGLTLVEYVIERAQAEWVDDAGR
jgi:hypothetical protein